ncbi:Inherit from bactNOG: 3-dehydroquinate dehydratase [Seminavis robusta]|uniref:Inherit from bactNOG: 3-dehydroquinate dehydratase n=1 Tax=Seminavis robusta TaxID=568900 RepID=A0A9N8H7S1_9STRA|nr:Inherit from bactNOG: 3-dehydroquinate dehydratase [Seminavis robusta]|eukprot:Sro190_g081980.1 Inherit from bactNOG: 3-dehydroquinate dehydratase (231) ;mRNA; r:81870-82562
MVLADGTRKMVSNVTVLNRGSFLSFVVLCFFFGRSTAWEQRIPTRQSVVSEGRRSFVLFSSDTAGGQDPVLRLPIMEAELAILGSDEDPTDLKTAIGDAKTAAEFGVRRSQLEFYDAFSNGDLEAMETVWSTESDVRCVHPGLPSIEGREAVMASWKQIFSGGKGKFSIEPARVQIEICGLTAICTCVEKAEGGGQLEALNIYKREGGSWRMTLHMAGPVVVQRGGEAFF